MVFESLRAFVCIFLKPYPFSSRTTPCWATNTVPLKEFCFVYAFNTSLISSGFVCVKPQKEKHPAQINKNTFFMPNLRNSPGLKGFRFNFKIFHIFLFSLHIELT